MHCNFSCLTILFIILPRSWFRSDVGFLFSCSCPCCYLCVIFANPSELNQDEYNRKKKAIAPPHKNYFQRYKNSKKYKNVILAVILACTHTHVRTHARTHSHTNTYTHTHTNSQTHTHTRARARTYIHIYTHTDTPHTHIHTPHTHDWFIGCTMQVHCIIAILLYKKVL